MFCERQRDKDFAVMLLFICLAAHFDACVFGFISSQLA